MNAALRRLALNNRQVKLRDQAGLERPLSPSYLSLTGLTLHRAGVLKEADLINQYLQSLVYSPTPGSRPALPPHLSAEILVSQLPISETKLIAKEWGRIGEIKKIARQFARRGLVLGLSDEKGNEFELPTDKISSATLALKQAGLLTRLRNIDVFLRRIRDTYGLNPARGLPNGRLNLARALEQYGESVNKLGERSPQLEQTIFEAAIESNLETQLVHALQVKYQTIMAFLNNLSDNISEAAMTIVNTAQVFWPGGNPTLMLYEEFEGKRYLVPTAVALPSTIIKVGQRIIRRELGGFRIPVHEDSQNPHVQAFLEEGLKVRNITYPEHVVVCTSFVGVEPSDYAGNRKMQAFMDSLQVAWPGERDLTNQRTCPLLTVPLKVIDPISGDTKKIGLLAIVKEGPFLEEDRRLAEFFANNAAHRLQDIMIRRELRAAVGAAESSAKEARAYAQKLEEMQQLQLDEERRRAMEVVAAVMTHDVKNILLRGAVMNENNHRAFRDCLVELDVTARALRCGISPKAEEFDALVKRADQLRASFENTQQMLGEAEEAVRGMLLLASQGNGSVAIKSFLETILPNFQIMAKKKGITLVAKLDGLEGRDAIAIPQFKLGAVLSNLILNSIDAFSGLDLTPKTIVVSARREGETVRMSVKDTGCGIPDDFQNKLFQPGMTTKGTAGTGFGLVQVEQVITESGGRVAVKSSVALEDHGSEFILTIPWIAKKGPTTPVPSDPTQALLQPKKVRVVYVDDQQGNLDHFPGFLAPLGIPKENIVTYNDPAQLLADFRDGKIEPTLIISDQDMGPWRGDQLLRQIVATCRGKNINPPFLAIFSGEARPATETVQALQVDNIHWIVKGAHLDAIRNTMASIIQGNNGAGITKPSDPAPAPTAYFAYYQLVAHKTNNYLAKISLCLETYVRSGNPGYLAAANEQFAEFGRYLASFQTFYDQFAPANLADKKIETLPLPEEIRENYLQWDNLPKDERYKLAVISSVYQEKAAKLLPEQHLVDPLVFAAVAANPSARREAVQPIEALLQQIADLNQAFLLDPASRDKDNLTLFSLYRKEIEPKTEGPRLAFLGSFTHYLNNILCGFTGTLSFIAENDYRFEDDDRKTLDEYLEKFKLIRQTLKTISEQNNDQFDLDQLTVLFNNRQKATELTGNLSSEDIAEIRSLAGFLQTELFGLIDLNGLRMAISLSITSPGSEAGRIITDQVYQSVRLFNTTLAALRNGGRSSLPPETLRVTSLFDQLAPN
ncbi:MAG: ATP-binding protein [Candidatus Margulisiibacteriota bacterium]